jgi:hypothetical protein
MARAATTLRAGAAAIRVGHRGEPLGLDVITAHRAGAVAPAIQTAQRRLDLLQLCARRVRNGTEHVIVLTLGDLLGKIGGQRIGFVAQVRGRIAGTLAQLVAAFEQSLTYGIDVHVGPPGRAALL